MEARDAEVTLDVVEADLRTSRKAQPFLIAAPGRDGDDAARRARAEERCCRRALDDFHAFDIRRVDVGDAGAKHDAVDDVQRLLASSGGVDRRRPAEDHLRRHARTATHPSDVRPRHFALQLAQRVHPLHRHLRRIHTRDGEGHLGPFRGATGHAGDHQFLQAQRLNGKLEVLRDRSSRSQGYGTCLRAKAHARGSELHLLPSGDSRPWDRQCVAAVRARVNTDVHGGNAHDRGGDTFAPWTRHPARDRRRLLREQRSRSDS